MTYEFRLHRVATDIWRWQLLRCGEVVMTSRAWWPNRAQALTAANEEASEMRKAVLA